jgi:hypothetical protein
MKSAGIRVHEAFVAAVGTMRNAGHASVERASELAMIRLAGGNDAVRLARTLSASSGGMAESTTSKPGPERADGVGTSEMEFAVAIVPFSQSSQAGGS